MVAMQGYLLSSCLLPLVDCAGSGTAGVGMDDEDDDLLGLSEGTVKMCRFIHWCHYYC